MAEGEIAHVVEQFFLGPQCFQLYLTIKLSFIEIFQFFVIMFSKSSAADLLYVGRVKINLFLHARNLQQTTLKPTMQNLD